MVNNLNRHQMPVYLLPRQYKDLKDLKKNIRTEYNISIPITEILRDSVNMFLNEHKKEKGSLELYLKGKGLIE